MAQETRNKIVVLEPCTETVEGLLKVISDKKQAEVVRVAIPEEAGELVRRFQPCMLVVCLNENSELPQRVAVLKGLESSVKYGLLKTLFVSKVRNKQIGTLITSLGVTDFIEEPAPLRTLQFKANLQLKALETIRKQQEMKKASQEKIVFKKSGEKGGNAAGGDGQPKPTPALQLDEDSFLFKNSGVKRNGKKYSIELEGPDPESGEWVPHEDKGDAQASWRWVPEEGKESPEARRGDGWVHEGDKPQYQEATNKWQFVSEKPELAYRKNGKKVAKKVAVNAAGEVTVAADSPKAEANIKKAKTAGERKREREAEKFKEARGKEKKTEAAKAEPDGETKEGPAKPKRQSGANGRAEEIGAAPPESAAAKGAPETRIGAEGEGENAAEAAESPRETGASLKEKRDRKKKKPALSPLEFLKQKKEKNSAMSAEEPAENRESKRQPIAGMAGEPGQVNDRRPQNESIGEAPEPRDRRKKGADPLDRFKDLLNENLPEAPEEEPAPETGAGAEEESPEVEAASLDSPASEKRAKLRGLEAAPPAEEEKPAPQPEKAAAEGKASREKKREVIREIQEILSEPLPEELPPEEEARLRKKFNLENADIGAKELARRERKARIEALKQSILNEELPLPAGESAPAEAKRHDLRPEEIENTWSQSGERSGKVAPLRRAFDSELETEEEEAGERAQGEEIKDGPKKKRGGAEGLYRYLPESKISPAGCAWEKAEEHYVYLPGEVRYHGFDALDSLLPLWIYRGNQIPELLGKTRQWRFVSRLPLQIKAASDLPKSVKDFLYGLKRAAAAATATATATANEETKSEAEAQRAEAEREEAALSPSEETPGETAEGAFPLPEESERPSSPSRKGKEGASGKISALYDSFEKDAKALRAGQESGPPEAGSRGNPVTQADTLEGIFDLGKKKKADASPADVIGEKVKERSPAIEAFLERRKKKERRTSPAPEKAEAKNPYLGIYVALSNSYNPSKDGLRSVARVLRAIEMSFGRCACVLLDVAGEDGLAPVLLGSGEIAEGSRIAVSSAHPIRRSEAEAPMGYLLLHPTGGREGFSDEEEANTKRVIAALWPAIASGRRAA